MPSSRLIRFLRSGPGRAGMLVALAGLACAAALGAAQEPALAPRKQDADRFERKLGRIRQFAQASPGAARAPQRTLMTQPEVNAYLWWHLEEIVPHGITEPSLEMLGDGRIAGRAVVDLTAIRQQKPRGWLDPLAYVGGQVEVTASGRLHTGAGMATLGLTSVTLAGVSVPKSILQELVTFYTRTPATPQGINLDDPFPLPAGIRQIDVGKGEATVIQ